MTPTRPSRPARPARPPRPRRRARRLVGVAVGAAAVLAVVVGSLPAAATAPFPVVGYAEGGSTPVSRLDGSAAALTSVVVDGVNVTSDGRSVASPSPEALALLRQAHARGERVELLVGNYDEALGDFSPGIADALLGSPANVDRLVAQLAVEVRKRGWDGVTVDLESLSGAHPAGLTRLVSGLKAALGSGRSVSVCLMATTGDYRPLGYDLPALGRAADHVVLMAYDQHGPTWSAAGPVGGMPWVKAALKPLLAAVPAARIQLGIAGYGYTWPRTDEGRQVSDQAARDLVASQKGTAVWSVPQQEWRATLRDGTVVWWSDARSYDARVALARQLGLGGVAVWSLGLSDPLTR
ncbi:glycosyl hydrolase family 18 protein [Clavibacter michiganensis]|uniref:glycosyl hydrolase family 18 protein n=1 Tax=Clavibacter michiganensis TaxID=28447 RepID=UPI001F4E4B28|nr:glycosyl hydrolase family 18 protein [Clavibacter michiganensis]